MVKCGASQETMKRNELVLIIISNYISMQFSTLCNSPCNLTLIGNIENNFYLLTILFLPFFHFILIFLLSFIVDELFLIETLKNDSKKSKKWKSFDCEVRSGYSKRSLIMTCKSSARD